MAIDNLSHNPDEYVVGKGIVTVKPDGEATWYDVGNVPEFEFTPSIEELPHFSSRTGVRTRDKTVILEKGGDLRIVLEEWTSFNLALILMADETTSGVDPDEEFMLDILSKSSFTMAVRFQGMNDIGPRWNIEFLRVDFVPSGSISPISDEWAPFEITGRVAAVAGVFGTATRRADGASPAWPA